MMGEYYRDAFGVNGFDYSWAGHLVAAGAEAVLGLEHEGVVVHLLWEVFEDWEVWVAAHPVVEEDGPDRAVKPTGEKC